MLSRDHNNDEEEAAGKTLLYVGKWAGADKAGPSKKALLSSMSSMSSLENHTDAGILTVALILVGMSFYTAGRAMLATKWLPDEPWVKADPPCVAGFYGGFYTPEGTPVAPESSEGCTAPPTLQGLFAADGAVQWDAPGGRCDWYKISKRRAPHVGYPGGVWQDGPEACEFSQATATPGSGPCNIVPGFGGAAQPVQRTWLGRVQTEHPVGGAYLEGTEVQVLWADGWTSALVEYKVPEAWKTKRGLEGCVDCYKVNFLDDDSFDFVSGTAMRLPHDIDRRSEAAGGPVDFGRGDEHESMEVRVSCGRAAPSAARRCSEQSASMKAGLKFCAEGWIEEAAWGPWSDALRFAAFDCGTPEGGESERYQPAFSPTDTWLGWSFKWDLGWGNCAVAWEGKTSYTFGLEVPSPIPQTPRRATTTKLDL